MLKKNNLLTTSAKPGMRLDRFWSEFLAEQGVARAKIQKWIKQGNALVNGQICTKAAFLLQGDEELSLKIEATPTKITPENAPLNLVYEDPAILVIDKPAGLVVHPAPGNKNATLVNRLIAHFPHLANLDPERPGIVHRLDKDTSGLLAIARTEQARLELVRQFADREVQKTYLALVYGCPGRTYDRIENNIGRAPNAPARMAVLQKGGRSAISEYKVIWTDPQKRLSLLSVNITTGRTHQIRVHLAEIGHPVLGDTTYGAAKTAAWKKSAGILGKLASRQMLHAWRLSFKHPQPELLENSDRLEEEQLSFVCPPPADFWRIPLVAARRSTRVVIVGEPGSGKSTVLNGFAQKGYPVWSADRAVAESYGQGEDGWQLIRARFGERFIPDPQGPIDKGALFTAMAEDLQVRREIESIIHPIAAHRADKFIEENSRAKIVFCEVPLFFESGWANSSSFDLVIYVDCPEEICRARLLARPGWDEQKAAIITSWGWPREKKKRFSNIRISNDKDLESLQKEIEKVETILLRQRIDKAKSLAKSLQGFFSGKDYLSEE